MDQDLLLRNEYLVAANRMLRNQITGRMRLHDGERTTLAELGKRLGKQALAEVVAVAKPETVLAWHRTRIARQLDGSTSRRYPERPRIDPAIEPFVIQFAQENRSWSYDRLVATAFFTTEVWTTCGLVTYDILFFIQVRSRRMHMAGLTPNPNGAWMPQMARNSTMAEWGFLSPGQHLVHDRGTKFCPAFQETSKAAGVTPSTFPPRSPYLNADPERWVRSVKEEVLSRLILFGEDPLRQALKEYDTHYHKARHHQGKGNELLMPGARKEGWNTNPIHSTERLGGLLKFTYRKAAGVF